MVNYLEMADRKYLMVEGPGLELDNVISSNMYQYIILIYQYGIHIISI